jgi:class 3 adenylate cyclase
MFTDIADYSESVAKMSRKESEEMLAAHDKILHKVIKQYKGKWIKSIGDSFLVVFRSPTDAALCGMAMHDALWEEMKTNEDGNKNIRIRVALNLGEVRLTRNDVFGEAVNVAARLEGITPADEIYLTESVYLSMNKAEVLATKVGSERFKGSPDETTYYKIPRGVARRVVADETGDATQNFDYPYGGAHLKAQVSDSDRSLEMISSIIDFRRFGMLSRIAMGIGALCLIAVAAYFFMGKEDSEKGTDTGIKERILTEQDEAEEMLAENENEPLYVDPEDSSEQSVSDGDTLSEDTEETEVAAEEEPIETTGETTEEAQLVSGETQVYTEAYGLLENEDFEGLQSLVDEYAATNPDDPYLFVLQGHLERHAKNHRDAIGSYEKGLEGDPALAANDYLANQLVSLLDYQPTRTKALIKANISGPIVERLSQRTGQQGIHTRHIAVKLLEDTDNLDKIDSVGMNIWDLKELEKCKEKKVAVLALRDLGDKRALPALKESLDVKFMERLRSSCFWDEAKAAIAEIEAK